MSSVDPISVRLVLFFSVPSCVCDLDFPAHAGRSLPSSPCPCPRALSQIGCLCSAFPSEARPLRSIEIEKFGQTRYPPPPPDLPLLSGLSCLTPRIFPRTHRTRPLCLSVSAPQDHLEYRNRRIGICISPLPPQAASIIKDDHTHTPRPIK